MDQNSVDQLLAQIQEQTADIKQQAEAAPVEDPGAKVAVEAAAASVAEIAGDMTPPPERVAPAAASAPVVSAEAPASLAAGGAVDADVRRLMSIEVPVIVQLGQRRMTVGEVMRLAVGAIVEFNKSADEELDLLVNNKPIGSGHAVKVGENFGIKLTNVGAIKETIRKLGGA